MIRIGMNRGHFWFRIGNYRVLWIKDVRHADNVLFSDRYGSWHAGPFAIQAFGFPRNCWKRPALEANERARRLMAWRAPDHPHSPSP